MNTDAMTCKKNYTLITKWDLFSQVCQCGWFNSKKLINGNRRYQHDKEDKSCDHISDAGKNDKIHN